MIHLCFFVFMGLFEWSQAFAACPAGFITLVPATVFYSIGSSPPKNEALPNLSVGPIIFTITGEFYWDNNAASTIDTVVSIGYDSSK